MLTKSKIALSFAVVLGAASTPPATHAFAQSNYRDCGGCATGSQKGKREEPQMKRDHKGDAIHEQRSNEPGAPLRWIDDPASPGG
jgi:hypothetical protein